MATEDKDDDKKKPNGMDFLTPPGGLIPDGSGPPQGSIKGGSGQFTNIKDYIEANRPKTQEMAEGVTEGVRGEAGELRGGLAGQREQYLGAGGEFGSGQQKFIQEQIDRAKAGEAGKQEDIDKFRGFATGAIKAPALDEERRQAADLERRTKGFETPKGRFEELQKLVGSQSATYGRGQRQLDQLLLAGDRPSRLKGIKDIRQATRGVGEQVSTLGQDIQAGRAARQTQAGGAETARAAADTARTDRLARLQGLDVGSTISDEDLAAMGVDREEVANLYGVDPSDYLGSSAGTPESIARLQALNALAGKTGNYQAYDPTALTDAISAAKSAYEKEYNPLQASADYYGEDINYDDWIKHPTWQETVSTDPRTGQQIYRDPRLGATGSAVNKHKARVNAYIASQSKSYADQIAAARDKYKYGQGLV